MLEIKHLSYQVEGESGEELGILNDVSLTVADHQFVVITGPNGGGKTTLAKAIMGLVRPTGGTIASLPTAEGLAPGLDGEALAGLLPQGIMDCYDITIRDILHLDSSNIQPEEWQTIARHVFENRMEYSGIVITHGTDTMAYTAAALSYLIQNSLKPIVITGAQKPIDLEITDAKTNLLDSLRFASSCRAHGVNLVFDGKVIAGTRAKKERTKSYNAFSSINFPYVAVIHDDHIIFYLDDKEHVSGPAVFYHNLDTRVALLKLIPSMDAGVLDYMAEHYDAVIIESFGVGGIPTRETGDFHSAIERLVRSGKTLVMTTQVTNEGSNMSVYEIGKNIKQEFGLLEAYDMTLEAVVTKLMWILGQTRDPQMVRELLYRTINRDILYPV